VPVVEASVAPCRQHHGVRPEGQELTGVEVHARGPEYPAVVGQQSADKHVLAVRDRQRLSLCDQGVEQRLTGVVARERRPAERLGTEVALVDITLGSPAVGHPPVVELSQQAGHPPGDRLDLVGVVEEVALVECVRGVD